METPENNSANENLTPEDNTEGSNAANRGYKEQQPTRRFDPLSSGDDSRDGEMQFGFEDESKMQKKGSNESYGENESADTRGNFRNRFADDSETRAPALGQRLAEPMLSDSNNQNQDAGRNSESSDNKKIGKEMQQPDRMGNHQTTNRQNEEHGNDTNENAPQNSGTGDFRSQQDNTEQSLRSREQDLGGDGRRNPDQMGDGQN